MVLINVVKMLLYFYVPQNFVSCLFTTQLTLEVKIYEQLISFINNVSSSLQHLKDFLLWLYHATRTVF